MKELRMRSRPFSLRAAFLLFKIVGFGWGGVNNFNYEKFFVLSSFQFNEVSID